MPKRSLGQGKNDPRNNDARKIEQLNRAVDALLARADGKPAKVEAGIEPLVRVAADLRDLPRERIQSTTEIRITEREKDYEYRC